MDVDAFVAAHQAEWDRLDQLVARRRRLTGDEVDELVAAYQRTATHLSELRSAGHDPALAARLSTRVARARAAVTGAHSPQWRSVGAVRAGVVPGHGLPGPLVVAGHRGRVAAGRAAAGLVDRQVARRCRPASLTPAQARQLVNHEFRGYYSQYAATSFAAKVWTNNACVAAESLIFGILLGIPTLLALLDNSVNIGAVGGRDGRARARGRVLRADPAARDARAVRGVPGRGGRACGWAGGSSTPARCRGPGRWPRRAAATVTIALGVAVALLVSGVIEAFVTPSPLPTWARILIGAAPRRPSSAT